jgi:cell division protease FtsH
VDILKVHVRDVPLDDDVELQNIASRTVGLTGADLRNIVNEAALWAARNNKSKVSMADFNYALDKILMGAKREEVLQGKEKEVTAYHEAGHTLLAWSLPGAHRVHKVTIIPRGRAMGVTQFLPMEDRMSMSESELRDQLAMALGGRAAELLLYNETCIGAENDLERATSIARRMVMNWGMSDKLGPVSYKLADDDPFLGREIHQQRQFSEHTLEMIDGEVQQILHGAAESADKILRERRCDLDKIAQALLKEEELSEQDITTLIGPSIHATSNGRPKASADISPGGIEVAPPAASG